MTVLVAYASRHGATEGIAARIVTRLADSGAAVDLRCVDEVEAPDAYNAVVFGAPVSDQSWPPEADRFDNGHRDTLAARPLWLFSVGSFGDTKRLIGPLTHEEPKHIGHVCAAIRPHEYGVFQGVIRKHQWPVREDPHARTAFSVPLLSPAAASLCSAIARRSPDGLGNVI